MDNALTKNKSPRSLSAYCREGHLLLRKFVNISVDLMTRGPPFGITQAYEAGEEGVHNIWPAAPLWTNGNWREINREAVQGLLPVATKFRHPFHSTLIQSFAPRHCTCTDGSEGAGRGSMVSPNTEGLNKIDFCSAIALGSYSILNFPSNTHYG